MIQPAQERIVQQRANLASPAATVDDLNASGTSWSAIIAGAAGTGAMSLSLLVLGAGLGLSTLSPWAGRGLSAEAVGMAAVAWLILSQIFAAGLGGYLAGRLRVRWANVPADEVYFRDTAHGFLAWAVGALATAALVSSTMASLIGGGVQAGAAVAAGAASSGQMQSASAGPLDRLVDTTMRTEDRGEPVDEGLRNELTRIYSRAMQEGDIDSVDQAYLASIISDRTGLSSTEAEQRITAAFTEAREAVDAARSAGAKTALWAFVALLSGAFSASLAALWGGRRRDL